MTHSDLSAWILVRYCKSHHAKVTLNRAALAWLCGVVRAAGGRVVGEGRTNQSQRQQGWQEEQGYTGHVGPFRNRCHNR